MYQMDQVSNIHITIHDFNSSISGLHQCVCNSGYHGYKCIQRTGSFPYAVFFSTSAATALAVVVLDWIIRRLIRYNGNCFIPIWYWFTAIRRRQDSDA